MGSGLTKKKKKSQDLTNILPAEASQEQTKAAIQIQSTIRAKAARKEVAELKEEQRKKTEAAIKIQSKVRANIAKAEVDTMRTEQKQNAEEETTCDGEGDGDGDSEEPDYDALDIAAEEAIDDAADIGVGDVIALMKVNRKDPFFQKRGQQAISNAIDADESARDTILQANGVEVLLAGLTSCKTTHMLYKMMVFTAVQALVDIGKVGGEAASRLVSAGAEAVMVDVLLYKEEASKDDPYLEESLGNVCTEIMGILEQAKSSGEAGSSKKKKKKKRKTKGKS